MSITIPVELDKATKFRYKELEDDFILKLNNGVVTAANGGVLSSKLRQFTGGAVISSPGVWDRVHDFKLDALDELIDEMSEEPLMVAYQFEHEFERIHARHPHALYIKGGMSKALMQETVEKWNTGTVPLLLIQPQAGSLGLKPPVWRFGNLLVYTDIQPRGFYPTDCSTASTGADQTSTELHVDSERNHR